MEYVVAQAERRKQVRLRRRPDLSAHAQRYEGRRCQVVKDPIGLKYYRLNEHEYFVFEKLDGKHTLEDIRVAFEEQYRPERLTLEDLESFARQLVTSGLVQHESTHAADKLYTSRKKQQRLKRFAQFTNILYLKVPVFDPDRLLTAMVARLGFVFTRGFLYLSFALMLAAVALVTLKFQVFWDKLPAYQEFFRTRTLLYLWLAMGVVKLIHEFGHGLTCKAFGGECHEMGALFMCFSPALYCNVTDSWTLGDKWKRILISFAGIYVELIIAAISTFVWWYTPHWVFVNHVALCLMTLCSISTFVFNANPLMRFDGYYILADWLEVPNLRERANKYLGARFQETCLGIKQPAEQYMIARRKALFLTYAIASYVYRWVVTFGIVIFLSGWLKPYKLESLSVLLAFAAVGSMVFWPLFRLVRSIRQRGRLPDMNRKRVLITLTAFAGLIAVFFFVPLPVSRVRETGLVQLQEGAIVHVYVGDPGGFLVAQFVRDGDIVKERADLARFTNPKKEGDFELLSEKITLLTRQKEMLVAQMSSAGLDPMVKSQFEGELSEVQGALRGATGRMPNEERTLAELRTLKAPRGGVVMNAPKKEEMFKFWDRAEATKFCDIGDPTRLRILIPITPPQYQEIKENLDYLKRNQPNAVSLEASILLSNRSDKIYRGRVTGLPDTNERNVPIGLTSKGGGPLAVKPGSNPNVNEPLTQTYLVQVEIMNPDGSIAPGALANVKIHLRWRTVAWWMREKAASVVDWGLW